MDDRAEVHGSKGVAYADRLQGNSIQNFSLEGYDYALEKAGNTKGWTFTIYDEAYNFGFDQEITGCKVSLPFKTNAEKPIDLWKPQP